jgi:hypothetical protein
VIGRPADARRAVTVAFWTSASQVGTVLGSTDADRFQVGQPTLPLALVLLAALAPLQCVPHRRDCGYRALDDQPPLDAHRATLPRPGQLLAIRLTATDTCMSARFRLA